MASSSSPNSAVGRALDYKSKGPGFDPEIWHELTQIRYFGYRRIAHSIAPFEKSVNPDYAEYFMF